MTDPVEIQEIVAAIKENFGYASAAEFNTGELSEYFINVYGVREDDYDSVQEFILEADIALFRSGSILSLIPVIFENQASAKMTCGSAFVMRQCGQMVESLEEIEGLFKNKNLVGLLIKEIERRAGDMPKVCDGTPEITAA